MARTLLFFIPFTPLLINPPSPEASNVPRADHGEDAPLLNFLYSFPPFSSPPEDGIAAWLRYDGEDIPLLILHCSFPLFFLHPHKPASRSSWIGSEEAPLLYFLYSFPIFPPTSSRRQAAAAGSIAKTFLPFTSAIPSPYFSSIPRSWQR